VIALVDYGAGNLTSVRKALHHLGADVTVMADPAALGTADAIIVPGVGHFGATASLGDAWKAAVRERVEAGYPVLGICLGMQWLFEGSDEAPGVAGLGIIKGRVTRLKESGVKVPHVGWNALMFTRPSRLLDGLEPGAQVYFTHAYAAPVTDETVAVTEHGQDFASIVESGRVAGVQFHPEKSADVGLQILRNFFRCLAPLISRMPGTVRNP
jgi:glutamine amidotransferase